MVFYSESNNYKKELQAYLSNPEQLLVVCYCAAWCRSCEQYRIDFEQLHQQMPEVLFVWCDIEDEPELLDDFDVDNFPTLLIQKNGQNLFFGTMLPHISHLQRLIQNAQTEPSNHVVEGPRAWSELLDLSA
ncbi:thioredoxin family protein [Brackiella oedipodis]|uniref:thioredoxin family protein n=1 Tax=Brackiella oedipodis TaxID=124225 RepID=UPI000490AC30|nr:thioredoxin family protein [Brackiella oedipodis]